MKNFALLTDLVFNVTLQTGVVEVVVVVLVLVGLGALLYGLYRWFKGSGPVATPTTVSVRQNPSEVASASASKTVTVILKRKSDGNPIPSRNVTFTIKNGTDGKITSNIGGQTTVTVATDALGEATVKIIGSGNGNDELEYVIGGSTQKLPYETTN